jgi:RNA polymerase sigma-70 factor, ECF subfamily
MRRGDVDAVVTMLTEDATWSMPPLPGWYGGHEAVVAFLTAYPLRERWRHVPTRANGQLAVGCYMWDAERQSYVAAEAARSPRHDDARSRHPARSGARPPASGR